MTPQKQTVYRYDISGELVVEINDDGTFKEYIYADEQPIAMIVGQATTDSTEIDDPIANVLGNQCSDTDAVLENQTISSWYACAASGSVNVTGTVTVEPTGDLVVLSPQAAFHPGFRIDGGGTLIVSSYSQTNDEIYYYHTDHLDTPQWMTDNTQEPVWQAGKDPFGADIPTIQDIDNNSRFPEMRVGVEFSRLDYGEE